ncbi:MAG: hypothetical protein IKE52_05395 [Mogibacterium sp.]|nr:hypothetical protein [Mogibacterium sp.]
MNNRNYQQQIIEIDLREVFWRLLSQWKALLLVAVLMAALVCAAKYSSDTKAYNAIIDAQTEETKIEELSAEERIENMLSDFSVSERETVEYVVHEKEWLAKQREYANKSVLMHTDPTNQRVLKQIYDLDMENSDDYPVLIRSFYAFARGDECAGRIKEYIEPGAENKYISELFYSYDSKKEIEPELKGKGAALELNLVLPEDADADAVSAALSAAVTEYGRSMASHYPHSIALAEQKVVYVYHTDNTYKYTKTFNDINYFETAIKTAEGTLSAKQQEAVDTILSIKAEQESGNIGEGAAAEGSADDVEEAEAALPAAPVLSKKHSLLGFMLGLFIYAAAYVLMLIIKGNVSSSANAAAHTGARLLGEVYYEESPKGLMKLFRSRLVDKYRYRGKTDVEIQIDKISETVDAICEHSGAKAISLLNAYGDCDIIEKLAEAFSAKGIAVDIVDVAGDFDEKTFLEEGNAVLAVGGDTKLSKLSQLMSLSADYERSVLGSVYLGSY